MLINVYQKCLRWLKERCVRPQSESLITWLVIINWLEQYDYLDLIKNNDVLSVFA